MSISRVRVYGLLLLVVLLGLPSRTVADGGRCFPWETPGADCGSVFQGPESCESRGNVLWMDWRAGKLLQESSGYIINGLPTLKEDCPLLAGSVDRILKAVKAHQKKKDKAGKHVKKTAEALTYYGPRCPPGMFHVPC